MFLTTWFVSNLLLVALVFQLARYRVYSELPLFSACTLFRLFQALVLSIALSWSEFLSTVYLGAWFITESIAMVMVALASAECYVWLTRRIFRLGWIGTGTLIAAALIGGLVMIGTRLDSAEDLSRGLASQLKFKQFLMGFLAVTLAILMGFYWRFPLHVPRQAWPHALTQLMYLAIHSLSYAIMVAGGLASTADMNEILPFAWIACLALWIWIFRRGVTWPDAGGGGGCDSLQRADEQAKRLERML